MKTCGYCGAGNDEERTACHECGTELTDDVESPPTPRPPRSFDFAGFKVALLGASALITAFAFYLLSFGPVARWYVVQTPLSTSPTVTNSDGTIITEVISISVSMPAWVDTIYGPLMEYLPPGGHGDLRAVYTKYLEWCQKSAEPAP